VIVLGEFSFCRILVFCIVTCFDIESQHYGGRSKYMSVWMYVVFSWNKIWNGYSHLAYSSKCDLLNSASLINFDVIILDVIVNAYEILQCKNYYIWCNSKCIGNSAVQNLSTVCISYLFSYYRMHLIYVPCTETFQIQALGLKWSCYFIFVVVNFFLLLHFCGRFDSIVT
jgi:hypothetical protein